LNLIDPLGLKTTVIVLYDPLIGGLSYGSHAALLVDNGGEPVLYDPAGSYAPAHRCGSGDACGDTDADIQKYQKYHEQNGSTLQLFVFNTTLQEEKQIVDRIEQIGGVAPFLCATSVSTAIKGIGPFKDLKGSPLPGTLAKQLSALPRPSHGVSGAW
jgi:hypothetical protein